MRLVLPLMLLAVMTTACNRPTAQAPNATAPVTNAPAATASTPEPAVDHDCAFCADPGVVRTCEIAQGVRTTLWWNLPEGTSTLANIFVVDDSGKDVPFAQQPPRGSILTGPWLKPGLTFKLKDTDGKLLHSVVITGKDC